MSHVEKYGSFRLRSIYLERRDTSTGIVIRGEEYCHDIWYDGCMFMFNTKICFEI